MKLLALLLSLQLGQAVVTDRALVLPGDAGVPADLVAQLTGAADDAGVPFPVVEQLTAAALEQPDAGWVAVGPGCYEPTATCLGVGQVLARQGAEVPELERVPPGVKPQIIAASIGFALGIVAGVVAVYGVCSSTSACSKH